MEDRTAPQHLDCPPTPQQDSPQALGFRKKKMVRWFTPSELIRAGIKAVLSSLFGSYADKREVQALQAEQAGELALIVARRHAVPSPAPVPLPPDVDNSPSKNGNAEALDPSAYAELIGNEVCDYSKHNEVWFDFIADLGDGFDSTYTMARLLAEPRLVVTRDGQKKYETTRGQILLMGGDQVYPTATREEYNDRMVGPYQAALPCVLEDEPPKLFAIPGNHDWYDGLTSFIRLFCQGRWIGGWKTTQRRSYFAIRLPHDWWIWGIDIQLASDIDLPQLKYFEALASNRNLMQEGAKIILCIAEPSWVFCGLQGVEAYKNLGYFEANIIRKYKHTHVIGLSGDLHTYARYEEVSTSASKKQRFISGGGGAYLYPTHHLPAMIQLPNGSALDDYTIKHPGAPAGEAYSVFPDRGTSQRRAFGALLFPFMNIRFALLLGGIYLFLAWMLQSTTRIPALPDLSSLLGNMHTATSIDQAVRHFWTAMQHSPGSILFVLALFGGFVGMADMQGIARLLLGLFHTLLHLITLLLLMWAFATLNLGVLAWNVESTLQVVYFAVEMVLIGGFVGGFVIGVYLLLSHLLLKSHTGLRSVHANEVFNSQAIPDYKHFLRFHVDSDGVLTIYPIGVQKVVRKWRLNPTAVNGQAWLEPTEGSIQERAALIETPITVA